MKLSRLIKLIDFGYNVPVNSCDQVNSKTTLRLNDDGLHYWQGTTIDMFEIFDNKSEKKEKINVIEHDLKVKTRDCEFVFYYALFSLFYSAGTWLKKLDNDFDVIDYATYYTLVHIHILTDEIKTHLDFSQIEEMSGLITHIQDNTMLYQKLYLVNVYDYPKAIDEEAVKENSERYKFGNLQYHEPSNKVRIDLYEDVAVVKHDKSSTVYEYKMKKNKNKSIEKQLKNTLTLWHHDWQC